MSEGRNSLRSDLSAMKADLKHLVETVDKVSASIEETNRWRHGDADQPGVNLRLDRLETTTRVAVWAVGALLLAISGYVAVEGVKVLARGIATAKASE